MKPSLHSFIFFEWWAHQIGCAQNKIKSRTCRHLNYLIGEENRYGPQNSAPAISLGKSWWWTVLEKEISCSECEGSECPHEWSSFLFFWRGRGRGICCFFPYSQCVPIKSSNCSQVCSAQDNPNSTWVIY